MMFTKQILVGFLLMTFLSPQPILAYTAQVESSMIERAPEIDGVIGAEEWNDATKLNISAGGYTIYFYIKHDGSYFYLALDVTGTDPPDVVQIAFDWKNDADLDNVHDTGYMLGGPIPPIHLTSGYRLALSEFEGRRYVDWFHFWSGGESLWSYGDGRNQFELKIPLGEIYFTAGETIGFCAAVFRTAPGGVLEEVARWPPGSTEVAPATWADLTVESLATRLYDPSITLTYTDLGEIVTRLIDLRESAVTGREVSFEYWDGENWVSLGLEITNGDGYATLSWATLLKPDNYTIRVSFAGDGFYENSSFEGTLVIRKEVTRATISISETIEVEKTVSIRIAVTDDEGNPVPDLPVRIYINENLISEANADKRGELNVDWTPTKVGEYTIKARVMGGNYYQDFVAQKNVKVAKTAILPFLIGGLVIAIIAITAVLFLKKSGRI